ncbi:MAG: amidase [Terriglobales bacterium]
MLSQNDICALSLRAASAAVKTGELSPVDLTQACLERIARVDREYNSFIAVYERETLAQAEALAGELRQGGWRGPLHGIPIALKDLVDVAGQVTTAASALFADQVAHRDAEVVRRLKQTGAVILGKTNLHEFAYGGSGIISHFGVVRNPVNPRYITGGSSSGSAAAVAAGFCFAAIGTDTAGSIRLPAAYCGVVGLKPTYGAVSTEGVVPLAWSYDHVGPITRTVEDAEMVLRAISESEFPELDGSQLRFGIARNYFFEPCDPEITAAVIGIAEKVRAADVELPVDEDRTVSNAEAFAYHQELVTQYPDRYNKETLRRIRSGENISAAAYIRKRRELDDLRQHAHEIFRDVDVVITPTVPIPPTLISELEANPEQLRPRELMMLRNTRPFNVLGIPAMSVPCGRMSNGLPIGVQLASAPGRDDVLIAAGKMIEKLATD